MAEHEIEIEILPDGGVRARINGAKGEGCLAYAALLERIIGEVRGRELTSEYYEPGEQVRLDLPAGRTRR